MRAATAAERRSNYVVVVGYYGYDEFMDYSIRTLFGALKLTETGSGMGAGFRDISFSTPDINKIAKVLDLCSKAKDLKVLDLFYDVDPDEDFVLQINPNTFTVKVV